MRDFILNGKAAGKQVRVVGFKKTLYNLYVGTIDNIETPFRDLVNLIYVYLHHVTILGITGGSSVPF